MKYLKVYTDFAEVIEPINDAEAGRLFRAMLKYAESGETSQFSGNERYIWPAAKLIIDREAAFCEQKRQNGLKHKSKAVQDEANISKAKQDEAEQSETSQKEKKRNIKEKDKETINPIQSFIQSKAGRDDDDGLERVIERSNLHLYQDTEPEYAGAIEDAIRTMWRAESTRVNGRTVPRDEVRSVLKRLTINHIDGILDRLRSMDPEEPVTNGQAYLMACIYNAPADFAVNEKRTSWR